MGSFAQLLVLLVGQADVEHAAGPVRASDVGALGIRPGGLGPLGSRRGTFTCAELTGLAAYGDQLAEIRR